MKFSALCLKTDGDILKKRLDNYYWYKKNIFEERLTFFLTFPLMRSALSLLSVLSLQLQNGFSKVI